MTKTTEMNHHQIFHTILYLALFTLITIPYISEGQQNEEVTIIAPYQPKITDASKLSFSPATPEQDRKPVSFDFQYLDKKVGTTISLQPVEPVRFGETSKKELLRNYVKGGIGYPMTPYAEFFAGSLQSKEYLFSVHLKHLSSQGGIGDYGPNNFSHNLLSAAGKRMFTKHTLSAGIDYNYDVVHFYGYQPDSFPGVEIERKDIRQRFQDIGGSIRFGSNPSAGDSWTEDIGGSFYYFDDKYGTSEWGLDLSAGLSKDFSSGKDRKQIIGVDLGWDNAGISDSAGNYNPFLLKVMPYFRLAFGQYELLAGLNVNYDRDSAASLKVYPEIRAEVGMLDDMMKIYAGISGGTNLTSFKSLVRENPFVVSSPDFRNQMTQFELRAGIKGHAGVFGFQAEVRDAFYKDMPFFVNDTSILLMNRFVVIYDKLNQLSFSGTVGVEDYRGFTVRLSAGYHVYTAENQLKPWHKPSMELLLDARYALQEKYVFKASLAGIGSRYARGFSEDGEEQAVKLKGAADLNFGFEYRINTSLSAFLDLNNILNEKYQLWNRYPVQGFQAMVGVGFSF